MPPKSTRKSTIQITNNGGIIATSVTEVEGVPGVGAKTECLTTKYKEWSPQAQLMLHDFKQRFSNNGAKSLNITHDDPKRHGCVTIKEPPTRVEMFADSISCPDAEIQKLPGKFYYKARVCDLPLNSAYRFCGHVKTLLTTFPAFNKSVECGVVEKRGILSITSTGVDFPPFIKPFVTRLCSFLPAVYDENRNTLTVYGSTEADCNWLQLLICTLPFGNKYIFQVHKHTIEFFKKLQESGKDNDLLTNHLLKRNATSSIALPYMHELRLTAFRAYVQLHVQMQREKLYHLHFLKKQTLKENIKYLEAFLEGCAYVVRTDTGFSIQLAALGVGAGVGVGGAAAGSVVSNVNMIAAHESFKYQVFDKDLLYDQYRKLIELGSQVDITNFNLQEMSDRYLGVGLGLDLNIVEAVSNATAAVGNAVGTMLTGLLTPAVGSGIYAPAAVEEPVEPRESSGLPRSVSVEGKRS